MGLQTRFPPQIPIGLFKAKILFLDSPSRDLGKGLLLKLSTELLITAYSSGYFPMPHPETEEICWFNPDPRAILPLDSFHVSKSLRRSSQKRPFEFSFDRNFLGVIEACADRQETWINQEIKEAYYKLFRDGVAHSVEVWLEGVLVGGSYGLSLGAAFFAESMFHTETDASKLALWHLVEHLKQQGFHLLEVQFLTPHLKSLGAKEIAAKEYSERLNLALRQRIFF